jgi:DNA-binding NtrC family response regulator
VSRAGGLTPSQPVQPNKRSKVSVLHDAPIIGESPAFCRVLREVEKAAGIDCSVMFSGPSGVGKGKLARHLHQLSARRDGPFVICSAADLPESIAQRELFGHVRGAYSGADLDQSGLLQMADHGTIFIDDVDKLPLIIQSCLLRFLDDFQIRPIGSPTTIQLNVRVLAATNQNLEVLAARGLFLNDLRHRLGEIGIEIPPLHERKQDVRLLVEYFVHAYANDQSIETPRIHEEVLATLEQLPWPGGVRELGKAVLSCLLQAKDGLIKDVVLNTQGLTPSPALPSLSHLSEEERRSKEIIVKALDACKWKMSEAAKLVNLSLRTFQRDCARLGIRLRGKRG